jgi:Histidine kinase-, DNA gyrase B-, and HSP90-like ATPase
MITRVGAGRLATYPAMRELLRQGVAEAEADVAFVALPDTQEQGKRATLEIPAVFPLAERSAQLITRWVRKGVCRAIEAGRTKLMVGRISSGGDRRRSTKMLAVAPMYTSSGSAWGAVAMVRGSSVVDWEMLQAVQQCARTITTILTQSDYPYSYSTCANTQPQVSRPRVQSGPRNDFLLHELRVPLSAATYALDALAQHHGSNWDYDATHQLHTAQSGIAEAQRIIRSVSQWPALGNSMTAPHLEAVAVDEALARALTLLPAAHDKIMKHLDPHLPAIWGDESWITQVLVNLLENALKYSNAHRNIEVAAYQSDDDFVLVSVRSWSKVLPVNRGYYTREGEQGKPTDDPTSKGLGLNIARYFITSLGGELWIEGDGTEEFVVTLALPIVASHAGQPLCTG